MILYLLLLLAGFALLIKGADLFVDGAARLARGLNVSPMAIGLTVVAFGTSAPELFTNIAAAVSGDTALVLGNVVGSNIANILLILGVSAFIHPLGVSRSVVWKEIPFNLLAAVILWGVASDTIINGDHFSSINRSDGLVLIGYFTVFMAYTVNIAAPVDGLPRIIAPVLPGRFNTVALKMAVGFCGLLIGGRMTVDSASILAGMTGIPGAVVGLTVVAVGTSLPELATSIMAARRGYVELAVGNVVGSNIFNIFLVLGLSAVIRPVPFEPRGHVDMGVMTAASILLFIFMFTGQERIMDRWEGALAILIYCLYIGFLLFSVYPLGRPPGVAG